MTTSNHTPSSWNVCDTPHGTPCLYSDQTTPASHRCIRHGSLLDYYPSLNGKTRVQARAALAKAVQS